MAQKHRKRDFQTFWHRIRFKYKLSFINEGTLEEVWSFRMSQLSAFVVLFAFALLVIAFTAFIIIKTPIRNYLPGYLDVEVRKEIMMNALRADSLERIIEVQTLYLDNVTSILTGTMPLDSIRDIDSLALINANYEISRSKSEEEFVKAYEEEEKYNLTSLIPNPTPSNALFFYKPVNGVISSRYEADIRHYGVDLVAAPKESVLATLDGTVIFTGYDSQYGNIIQIQHKNGFISIYKHNELLLKKMGDQVAAGEAIALIGNTGNLSTGPHLHFELWYKGNPVNPEEYISF
ncbi:MAG: M23 family metallopeptidase [Tannerellaceae bacterium]|jgi:murein DD-endopeptidase MepM/ murein hydrolase activator NlpD|nr:M23 family metallopeptidase [Tannerellaceae bacterium]